MILTPPALHPGAARVLLACRTARRGGWTMPGEKAIVSGIVRGVAAASSGVGWMAFSAVHSTPIRAIIARIILYRPG